MLVRTPLPLPDFCATVGISRAHAYREAARGNLDLRKLGRRAVVTADEAARYLANLPRADVERGDR